MPAVITNMWAWSTRSIFIACLPGFLIQRYTIPHWKVLAVSSVPSTVFLLFHEAGVHEVVLTMISLVFLSCLFEKNSRYHWVVQDTYKKSNTLYRNLHQEDPNGVLVLDPSGEIINSNHAAD